MEQQLVESDAGEMLTQQYLVLEIGDESFGVPIDLIQEIIGFREVTHVPNAPAFLKGFINLRGDIVPVSDTRIQFGLETKEFDQFNVIIILLGQFALDEMHV